MTIPCKLPGFIEKGRGESSPSLLGSYFLSSSTEPYPQPPTPNPNPPPPTKGDKEI